MGLDTIAEREYLQFFSICDLFAAKQPDHGLRNGERILCMSSNKIEVTVIYLMPFIIRSSQDHKHFPVGPNC